MVVRDEPQLGPGHLVLVVGRDEAQDVLVSQHDRLVDLGLAEPGLLVSAGENLDGHVVSNPVTSPDLAVPPLAHALHQADLPGDAPLHQERVAGAGAAVALLQHVLHGGLALVQVGRHRGLLGAEINDDGVGGREMFVEDLIAKLGPEDGVENDQDENDDDHHQNGHQDGQHVQHIVLVFI